MDDVVKLKASLLQAEERLASTLKERDAAGKEVQRLKEMNQRGGAELQKAISACFPLTSLGGQGCGSVWCLSFWGVALHGVPIAWNLNGDAATSLNFLACP